MADPEMSNNEDVFDFDDIVMSESAAYDKGFQVGLRAGTQQSTSSGFSTGKQIASRGTTILGYYNGLSKNLLNLSASKLNKSEEDKEFDSFLQAILSLTDRNTEDQKQIQEIVKSIHIKVEAAKTQPLLKNRSNIWLLMKKYDGSVVKPDFSF